ncbi:MAG: acetoin dehydrogenase dihydrolipoyllysine-residue acetyltransferase subunit [Paracoccaceae bacterium]
MPVEVIMPKVDMDMIVGKIMAWHVAPGEAVVKGDPLFDIETDKAAMEVEAPASGILHHTVGEGAEVAIGQPVAWLYAPGEIVGDAPRTNSEPAAKMAKAPRPPAPEKAGAEPTTNDKFRASPRARKMAQQKGIALDTVMGSGPRGRIQSMDVQDHIEAKSTTPAAPAKNTGALHITRSKGGNGIPFVLLHGFAADAASWASVETHLSHRPVIRIDLPAHGRSQLHAPPSFKDLASRLRSAFDMLDLETAHIVGHSLGGALALAIADTRPRKVSGLTLIAPAGLGPDINGDALNGICRATRAESLGPWLKTLVADDKIVSDGYVRAAMQTRENADLRAAQRTLADTLFPDGVQAFDMSGPLDRLDVPTRIIWGKQDRIIPWKHALRARGQVALHLFERVGHMPQIEISEEVGKLIATPL